jgi:hypothetical protein
MVNESLKGSEYVTSYDILRQYLSQHFGFRSNTKPFCTDNRGMGTKTPLVPLSNNEYIHYKQKNPAYLPIAGVFISCCKNPKSASQHLRAAPLAAGCLWASLAYA